MIKQIERADGPRWQVYGRRNGRKVYISTHTSEKDAIAADEENRVTERRIKSGELPPEIDGKRLLGPALDEWLKDIEQQRAHEAYASRVTNHIKPTLTDMPLVKLTTEKLKRLCIALANGSATKSGEAVSRSTIDGVLATLSSAWSYFIERGWVPRGQNPIAPLMQRRAGRAALDGVIKRHVKPAIEWIRTPAEVTKLLAACSPSIRTIIALLVGTGLRIDEALHLEWRDIDLEHRRISVQRGRKGPPKSGRARTVPILDPNLLGVLREMMIARGDNTLLWPGRKRDKEGRQRPLNQSGVFRAFKAAVVKAGLSKRLRIHDMRHTFAGQYLTAGGDIYRLSKILGHSSVKITQDTYAHLRPDVFEMDFGRVSFAMPSDAEGKVIPFPPANAARGAERRQAGDSAGSAA